MDPVQQLSFAVALSHNDFHAELGRLAFDQRDQIVMGGVAVNLGLATAEPAEVGSVEDVDLSCAAPPALSGSHCSVDRRRRSSSAHLRVGGRQQGRVRPFQPAGLGQAVEHHDSQPPERVFLSPAIDSKPHGRRGSGRRQARDRLFGRGRPTGRERSLITGCPGTYRKPFGKVIEIALGRGSELIRS